MADCPLYLRLLAGPNTDVLSFVLKENETGEVEVGSASRLQEPSPQGMRVGASLQQKHAGSRQAQVVSQPELEVSGTSQGLLSSNSG